MIKLSIWHIVLPTPSPEQLRWHEAEFGMFCHFSMNTFNNREWSDGTCDVRSFNPKHLDCEQWVKVAKAAGARYMILTCKHHDGFCLWPSQYTEYSVKNSPYKNGHGDIVAEFVDACRKYDMKIGFYLSPWDRHEPCYSDAKKYDEYYCNQLTELLRDHVKLGELFEMWFDGAGSAGHVYDWDKIIHTCKQYQPQAMIFGMGAPTIRWVGNERGFAKDANWNPVQRIQAGNNSFTIQESVDGTGNYWCPAECDVPIRLYHWFWHKSLWGLTTRFFLFSQAKLLEIFEKSIGRGSNLLLNLAPTDLGVFNPTDVQRLMQTVAQFRKLYGTPIIETSGTGNQILLSLPQATSIRSIMIQEEITEGQRVKRYHLEGQKNGQWTRIAIKNPTLTIGYKKIDRLVRPLRYTAIRLVIEENFDTPLIKSLKIF